MVEDAVIAEMVGAEALRRAREYATDGGVLSVQTVERNGILTLFGSVQGRAPGPYTVVVTFFAPDRNLGFGGSCTCPVRHDCKHVAAVVLADDLARAVRGDPGRTRGEWARALQGVLPLGPVPAAAAEPVIGLQFELTADQRKGAQLVLRPVARGSSGRWGRMGISWTSLAYHRARHSGAAAVRLLEEMYALNARRDRYHHYGREEQVLLSAFPTGRVWDILAQAGEAGLALVRAGRAEEPVLVAAEPGRVSIDLSEAGSEWRLRPVVTAGPEALDPAQSLLLGDPAHGVAWWRPGGGYGAGPLHVARLDREVPGALRDLVARGRDLVVPADEQTEFLRDYYPAMRRQVTLTSADGSVELPTPRPPRLALRLEYAPGHRVTVRWSWRYAVGDAVREAPLRQPQHVPDPDRDSDGEAKILQEVAAHTDTLAALSEPGPAGPRLAARAELAGADALIGLAGVLTGIRGLADVEVRSVGEVLQLRPAVGPPVVSVGGSGSGTDWFDLEVSVSVDGEDVPFADLFSALALGEHFLILPSGAYVGLDRPELHQLRELISEARALGGQRDGSVRISRYQAGLWHELTAIGVVADQAAEWTASVRALAGVAGRLHAVADPDAPPAPAVPEVEPPAGMSGILRPYQQEGFAWLSFLYDHGLGGVLADDMGLGKTLQAITLIRRTREAAPAGPPFLVVAPTSVVGNWVAEVRRFAPGLTVGAVSETVGRRGVPLWAVAARTDVVVTSYTLLRLEYDDYAALDWSGLILDEAQALKNHSAKGHQCAKRLPVPFKLAITGTPMENNLTELWAIFSLVAPGLFPDVQRFGEYYRKPIEKGTDPDRLAQLRRRIRPLMLRRTKDEVAADLPPKVEQVISLELNPRHRRLYDTYLARERQKVLGLLDDMERHRIAILTSLTLLRQAALDITLVDPEVAGVGSTKLDALAAQVNEIVAEGHRVLVFSQFTRFLAKVRERLEGTGIPYCYLDGRTRNRAEVVETFTSGLAPVFLMSIKAGGVGLNLTQADYCILLDPWWNPATEAQAVDRAHRIGQTRTVMVYRLVAKDTIEEKVMALKEGKARLFSAIMDGSGPGSGSLTADDIRALLDG